MNKGQLKMVLAAALLFCLAPNARAFEIGTYEKMYTVASAGSTVETKEYANGSFLPVLYLKLPADGFVFRSIRWNSPSGQTYNQHLGHDTNREVWVSPTNWSAIAEHGTWTVNANYFFSKPFAQGRSVYTFQVNPEPQTILLFALGTLVFAVYHFCLRKRLAAR